MLHALHIENIAVIRRADVDFESGFSVLTGETGAGKSMIIDSINLLLGNRVPREIIRTGESYALVSAFFDGLSDSVCKTLEDMGYPCEDGSLVLQRRLNADGRSQTKLNGQSITQGMQKEIARMLISIHGQSDSQKLLQKSAHLELLDAYAHPDQALEEYHGVYHRLKELRKQAESVNRDESEKLRLREILSFQISDIDALKLRDGEEETLLHERDRLQNMERINQQAELCHRALQGGEKVSALSLIARAENALNSLGSLVEGVDALSERLAAAASEIEDVAETVLGYLDDDREDPTVRIDRIEDRLEKISRLKKKYGASIAEILAYRECAQTELDALDSSDELREKLEKEINRLTVRAKECAAVLTEIRVNAAKEVVKQVTDALTFLDMPKVRFEVGITPSALSESGADDVEFLIATNAGEPLQPMIKIASGGELSRIMLALRSVLNDRDGAATVIFDEIDTGISGKTSRKVGIKLKETASRTQVLCVTHSAQIASLADAHYLITKHERDGRAETDVSLLSYEARVEEIARILGGIHITAAQRDAAREMIEEYK